MACALVGARAAYWEHKGCRQRGLQPSSTKRRLLLRLTGHGLVPTDNKHTLTEFDHLELAQMAADMELFVCCGRRSKANIAFDFLFAGFKGIAIVWTMYCLN